MHPPAAEADDSDLPQHPPGVESVVVAVCNPELLSMVIPVHVGASAPGAEAASAPEGSVGAEVAPDASVVGTLPPEDSGLSVEVVDVGYADAPPTTPPPPELDDSIAADVVPEESFQSERAAESTATASEESFQPESSTLTDSLNRTLVETDLDSLVDHDRSVAEILDFDPHSGDSVGHDPDGSDLDLDSSSAADASGADRSVVQTDLDSLMAHMQATPCGAASAAPEEEVQIRDGVSDSGDKDRRLTETFVPVQNAEVLRSGSICSQQDRRLTESDFEIGTLVVAGSGSDTALSGSDSDDVALSGSVSGTDALPGSDSGTDVIPDPNSGTDALPVPTCDTDALPEPTSGTDALLNSDSGTEAIPDQNSGTDALPDSDSARRHDVRKRISDARLSFASTILNWDAAERRAPSSPPPPPPPGGIEDDSESEQLPPNLPPPPPPLEDVSDATEAPEAPGAPPPLPSVGPVSTSGHDFTGADATIPAASALSNVTDHDPQDDRATASAQTEVPGS